MQSANNIEMKKNRNNKDERNNRKWRKAENENEGEEIENNLIEIERKWNNQYQK